MKLIFEKPETGERLIFSDQYNEEYILAHYDFGTVEGDFNTTQFIDLIGSNVESATLEERDIYIRGAILADTPAIMQERKKKLKAFFNPQFDVKMIYKDYSMIFRPSRTIRDDENPKKRTNRFYQFHIDGIAHYPLWRLKNDTVVKESAIKGIALFPLAIPAKKGIAFGYIPAVTPNNIPNFGDVEVGFILRITASEGDVTNPKIINNKTGEEIEVNLRMTMGDIVEISTENGNKYAKLIRDEVETDIFDLITVKSKMSMKMSIGINDFLVTAAGDSSNLVSAITYSPGWLEVV